MKKQVLLLFSILSFSLTYAQYEWTPAVVILKNSTSLRGWVKFPKHSGVLMSIGTTKFKFRKNRKDKTEKYGSDTVDEVVFGDEKFATVHYKYVPIQKEKFVLMELLVQGNASLFARTVLSSTSIFATTANILSVNPNFPDNPNSNFETRYYDGIEFYVMRNEEEKATLLVDPNSFEGLILKAKKYFSDCRKIVDYLDGEVYELNNIEELVEDYNLFCQ
ncbi:hypothetical protein [Sediminibacter sp. Hel_I_10]|uniref:hypothetical protein n=1 Tax=Sediminibacter sp. Hel_I_10 TaxID=1392490 RepID=UPI00047E74E5|nr:hypothetical protein [Sediminibacter sp. Hel_I_10]